MSTDERPCIFKESLAVQEQLASTIRYTNESDRQRALGAITLTKETLRLHREKRDCWNACQGSTNCSIKEWVMISRSGAAAAWKGDEFPAALEMGRAVTDKDSPLETTEQRLVGFTRAQE